MPEVAVDEYRDLGAGKNHVRAPGQAHDVNAVAQSPPVGTSAYGPLKRRIHAADARHVPTSLFGAKTVDHGVVRS